MLLFIKYLIKKNNPVSKANKANANNIQNSIFFKVPFWQKFGVVGADGGGAAIEGNGFYISSGIILLFRWSYTLVNGDLLNAGFLEAGTNGVTY